MRGDGDGGWTTEATERVGWGLVALAAAAGLKLAPTRKQPFSSHPRRPTKRCACRRQGRGGRGGAFLLLPTCCCWSSAAAARDHLAMAGLRPWRLGAASLSGGDTAIAWQAGARPPTPAAQVDKRFCNRPLPDFNIQPPDSRRRGFDKHDSAACRIACIQGPDDKLPKDPVHCSHTTGSAHQRFSTKSRLSALGDTISLMHFSTLGLCSSWDLVLFGRAPCNLYTLCHRLHRNNKRLGDVSRRMRERASTANH